MMREWAHAMKWRGSAWKGSGEVHSNCMILHAGITIYVDRDTLQRNIIYVYNSAVTSRIWGHLLCF